MPQARRVRRAHVQAATPAAESSSANAHQPAGPSADPSFLTPQTAMLLQQVVGNRTLGRAIAIQRDPPDADSSGGGVPETPRKALDRALSDKSSASIAAVSDFSVA